MSTNPEQSECGEVVSDGNLSILRASASMRFAMLTRCDRFLSASFLTLITGFCFVDGGLTAGRVSPSTALIPLYYCRQDSRQCAAYRTARHCSRHREWQRHDLGALRSGAGRSLRRQSQPLQEPAWQQAVFRRIQPRLCNWYSVTPGRPATATVLYGNANLKTWGPQD